MTAFTVFAWDPRKADENEKKHGVGFDEATSAFLDDCALLLPDPDAREARFILLAQSVLFRVLVVCYCYVEEDHVVRIISARKASPGEAARYFNTAARG
jgi:uncharacterized DUF497 family protein